MRKFILLCVLVLVSALSAAAQDYSKAEAFVGYSYVRFRATDSGITLTSNLNGAVGQVTFNATRMFGIVADFGGYRMSKISGSGTSGGTTVTVSGDVSGSVLSYLFGPRVSFRSGPVTPFAQVLFGGVHLGDLTSTAAAFCSPAASCTVANSDSAFATTIGGGVDVRVANHISIRLGQAEYLLTRFDVGSGTATQNNFRYSAGIVLH